MEDEIGRDGTRILTGDVRIGDYIRFAGHNATRPDEWWKVLSRAGMRVSLVNAAGSTRTRTLQSWDRIFRHPYSQKRL